MYPFSINLAPFIFTIATGLGVMVHDTQMDRATTLAITLPTAFASFAAVDAAIKASEQHVHVEKVSAAHFSSLGVGLPRVQPRDDDRRHYQVRKLSNTGQDNSSIWPSI